MFLDVFRERVSHLKDSPLGLIFLWGIFANMLYAVLTGNGLDPYNAALTIGLLTIFIATVSALVLNVLAPTCGERPWTVFVLIVGFSLGALPYLPPALVPVMSFVVASAAQRIVRPMLRDKSYEFARSATLGYAFMLLAGTWYIRGSAAGSSLPDRIGWTALFLLAAWYCGWRRRKTALKSKR